MTLELPVAEPDAIDATRSSLTAIDPALLRAVRPLVLGYALCAAAADDQPPAELRKIVREEIAAFSGPSRDVPGYTLTDETADRVVAAYREHYCEGLDPDDLR